MALKTVAFSGISGGWVRANLDLDSLTEIVITGEAFVALGGPNIGVVSWLHDCGLVADAEVVALMEDDDWFAVLTVHEYEVRQFVSDHGAVLGSELGELFADLPIDDRYGWAGDPELLAFVGIGEGVLADLAEVGMEPEMAVSEVAEAIGASDLLDEVE